jgi:hypothetical protein
MDIIDRTTTGVNSSIRFLVRIYHSKVNSDTSYRAQKTLNTVISTDPTYLIKVLGPYLFKYAEPISTSNVDFLLENDYTEEVNNEASGRDVDAATAAITMIKKLLRESDDDEREVIMEKVSSMLSDYCEYEMAMESL